MDLIYLCGFRITLRECRQGAGGGFASPGAECCCCRHVSLPAFGCKVSELRGSPMSPWPRGGRLLYEQGRDRGARAAEKAISIGEGNPASQRDQRNGRRGSTRSRPGPGRLSAAAVVRCMLDGCSVPQYVWSVPGPAYKHRGVRRPYQEMTSFLIPWWSGPAASLYAPLQGSGGSVDHANP
jgi:hypothetical protein